MPFSPQCPSYRVVSNLYKYATPSAKRTLKRNPFPQRRSISTYGYTQAKSLVYSQHGSPGDVLSYVVFLEFLQKIITMSTVIE